MGCYLHEKKSASKIIFALMIWKAICWFSNTHLSVQPHLGGVGRGVLNCTSVDIWPATNVVVVFFCLFQELQNDDNYNKKIGKSRLGLFGVDSRKNAKTHSSFKGTRFKSMWGTQSPRPLTLKEKPDWVNGGLVSPISLHKLLQWQL